MNDCGLLYEMFTDKTAWTPYTYLDRTSSLVRAPFSELGRTYWKV